VASFVRTQAQITQARELASFATDQKDGLEGAVPADGTFRCPSLPSRGFG
jgi:hypothetical protein